jgi:enterobacterial common antigen flippase
VDKSYSSSYSGILKSSAIVGGAQGVDLLIRMVRTKVIAMLLGPSGVGLIGIYQSLIELAGKLCGLGIRSSAVRQVAEANGSGDLERLGHTVKVLRCTCWITGIFGWLLTSALARPLSVWMFGNADRAIPVALLGAVLMLENVSGGQTALLQGVRRIKDLARVMIFSAAGGTVISIIFYALLGEQGIIPALLSSGLINLGFSWWLSRRVSVVAVTLTRHEIFREARPLVTLGLAFMWSGLLTAGVAFLTRGFIVRDLGIDASGIYQAAWGISGLFAGFILSAMGQDFYPRLTAVAGNNTQVNLLVNEQTEVGILLALPGLLATLAFSPLVIQVFYTAKFLPASEMLPWFVLGIVGRVIAWPMGFILLAKGSSNVFAATETVFNSLHLLFIWLGLRYFGILGVAIAFAAAYACYCVIVLSVTIRLSGFKWSGPAIRLICYSASYIGLEFAILRILTGIPAMIASLVLVSASTIYCLRQLVSRVGPDHRISKFVDSVPGVRRYFQV